MLLNSKNVSIKAVELKDREVIKAIFATEDGYVKLSVPEMLLCFGRFIECLSSERGKYRITPDKLNSAGTIAYSLQGVEHATDGWHCIVNYQSTEALSEELSVIETLLGQSMVLKDIMV